MDTSTSESDRSSIKRVLMISYFFYPRNDTALRRVAGFYNYLPEFGWQTSVLCPRWTAENCDVYDPEMESLLTQARTVGLLVTGVSNQKANGKSWLDRAARLLHNPAKITHRLRSRLSPHHLFREPIEMYATAMPVLDRYLREHRIDLIWATCPPRAPLGIADAISKRFGIPWVADFRDIFDQHHLVRNSRSMRRRILAAEAQVLDSASHIVTVSAPLARALRSRHQVPVSVITNGYDPRRRANGAEQANTQKFQIVYLGRLIRPFQNPAPLIEGIEVLLNDGFVSADEIEVRMHGPTREDLSDLFESAPGAAQTFVFGPWVSFAESARIQRDSTVQLVLAMSGQRGILTGKLFECLAANRPILCIPRDQEGIADVVFETKAGLVCDSTEEVVCALRDWIQRWRYDEQFDIHSDQQQIEKYSHRSLSEKLAGVFDTVSLTSSKSA